MVRGNFNSTAPRIVERECGLGSWTTPTCSPRVPSVHPPMAHSPQPTAHSKHPSSDQHPAPRPTPIHAVHGHQAERVPAARRRPG